MRTNNVYSAQAIGRRLEYKSQLAVRLGTTPSRSHDVVIRGYDAAGSVIETHKHTGDFKEW